MSKKISELPIATELKAEDLIPIVQDGENKVVEAQDISESRILWVNPNTSVNFAAQTVTLNSSDYDMYEVFFVISTTTDRMTTSGRVRKKYRVNSAAVGDQNGNGLGAINASVRYVSAVTETSIAFTDGFSLSTASGTLNNSIMIPAYIIGYKTQIFGPGGGELPIGKEVPLVLNPNVDITVPNGFISCHTQLNIVNLKFIGSFKVITAGTYHIITNIPEEYRPKNEVHFQANVSGMASMLLGSISTNGDVRIWIKYNAESVVNTIGSLWAGVDFRFNVMYDTHKDLFSAYGRTNIITGQETATNEFVDGKQVYVKRINVGNFPNASSKMIAHGITNFALQRFEGVGTRMADGQRFVLPYVSTLTIVNAIGIDINSTDISVTAGMDRSNITGFVDVYYTKN